MTTDTLFDSLAQAAGTDVFAAGIALGLIGTLVAYGRVIWSALSGLVWRRIAYSVTVDNRTRAHRDLSLWLSRSGALRRARRHRLAELNIGPHGRTKTHLVPAQGTHWFLAGGNLCHLSNQMSEKTRVGDNHRAEPLETLTLTLVGRHPRLVLDWVAEGRRMAAAEAARRIGPTLWTFDDSYWEDCGAVRARGLDTVVAEDDAPERLRDDLARFYAREAWYRDRGVPWRRGYLLHGPPGTGKSSLIRALASELGRDIATLDIGQSRMTDEDLRRAMLQAPGTALLVIEDIDAAFRDRDKSGADKGLTFSGLLNAIDGVAAQEGRALFMTTNHRDRLDPALIRPGRADVHAELGPVGAAAARAMFLRFFPDRTAEADRFAAAIGPVRTPPARIQSWLLLHAEDADAAAAPPSFAASAPAIAAAE